MVNSPRQQVFLLLYLGLLEVLHQGCLTLSAIQWFTGSRLLLEQRLLQKSSLSSTYELRLIFPVRREGSVLQVPVLCACRAIALLCHLIGAVFRTEREENHSTGVPFSCLYFFVFQTTYHLATESLQDMFCNASFLSLSLSTGDSLLI